MDRKRLTITLKKDLFPLIDEVIDGEKIRNRSHAIEYVITRALRPKIERALILAGGHGIKMRPFTFETPKSLIPIKGKPLLEYTIDLLKKYNFRDILIVIGHLGDKIKSYFGDGTKFDVKINYLEEKKENGTGFLLRRVKKYVKNTPFLTIYGDVLIEINLRDFVEFHKTHNGLVTMAVTSYAKPYEFGVVRMHGSKIVKFKEKPEKRKGISHLINAGLFVFDPKLIDYIPKKRRSMLERDVFPKLVEQGKLFGYPFEGKWYDVSTPEIYEEVLKEWRK